MALTTIQSQMLYNNLYGDASGNIGIGTSSPSAKLDVNGSVRLPDGYEVGFGSANTTYWLGDSTNNWHRFYTSGSERMRIDSSGNLLVGTTSGAGAKVEINKGNGGNNTGASNAAIYLPTDESTIQGSGTYTQIRMGGNIVVRGSGAVTCQAGNSGGVNLSSGATSWAAVSDENRKDIIEPISNALNKVSTLRAVIGKYKTDEEGTRRSFLIAQDVQAVLPEAVSEIKDVNGDEISLGLAYSDVIPLLVAAIKEQQAIITQLQADVATLKAQ